MILLGVLKVSVKPGFLSFHFSAVFLHIEIEVLLMVHNNETKESIS